MAVKPPSHDALSLLPGDHFKHSTEAGELWDEVKSAQWQKTGNGGKVWSYGIVGSEELIPYTSVLETKIDWEKRVVPSSHGYSSIQEAFPKILEHQSAMRKADAASSVLELIEQTHLSAVLKTAIICVMSDELENLKAAQFLIGKRVEQLLPRYSEDNSDKVTGGNNGE